MVMSVNSGHFFPSFFEPVPTFWCNKKSQASLVPSLVQHLSQDSRLFLLQEWHGEPDLV